ncbi:DUF721 domain-containing protein [Lutibaculum baratangense]|uniref:Zn-ribbon-containing protein n=1 Tax=Lutibaculum baratangense AMV1 TaxID=631454 RepID=V4RSV4_9HYPH|nr:DciA family protein [Lutibaculum baratangense]ESR26215.1 Zn-ribbon-containing protein [Lutibaculum baratangense AMV1]
MHKDAPASRKRQPNGPARLDRLADPLLKPIVAKAGFGSAAILMHWRDIVGPELAERSRPEKITWPRQNEEAPRPATLVVRAEGGDALEIQHMTRQIVDRVNAFLGWPAVAKVKVRQAPVGERSRAHKVEPRLEGASGGAETPDLSQIADPELREALARLARQVRPDTSA